MRIWAQSKTDILVHNWDRSDWREATSEATGFSIKQVETKAYNMGLHRKRKKVYRDNKDKYLADRQVVPECVRQGKCPHGGIVWTERVPWSKNFNAVCAHGGRWEI
jgi:predicted DNA-binding WGR domain protein